MSKNTFNMLNSYGKVTFKKDAPTVVYFYNDDGLFYVSPTSVSKTAALRGVANHLKLVVAGTINDIEEEE